MLFRSAYIPQRLVENSNLKLPKFDLNGAFAHVNHENDLSIIVKRLHKIISAINIVDISDNYRKQFEFLNHFAQKKFNSSFRIIFKKPL